MNSAGTRLSDLLRPFATLLCVMVVLLSLPTQGYTQASDDEYAIKAALIFKLSRFVTWPESEQNSLLICVAGDNPFAEHLNGLRGELSNQRKVDVKYLPHQNQSLKGCQVVFVSKSEMSNFHQRLQTIKESPILTISDIHGFCKTGGSIEITRRNNRLGFTFNMQVLKDSGLKVAAPLLQMSTLINQEKKQ